MPYIVLLGDSIFVSAPYTRGGPDVISQFRQLQRAELRASLLPKDGATTYDVSSPVVTHPARRLTRCWSVGGSTALMNSSVHPPDSTTQAPTVLSTVSRSFEGRYRRVAELRDRRIAAVGDVSDVSIPEYASDHSTYRREDSGIVGTK